MEIRLSSAEVNNIKEKLNKIIVKVEQNKPTSNEAYEDSKKIVALLEAKQRAAFDKQTLKGD